MKFDIPVIIEYSIDELNHLIEVSACSNGYCSSRYCVSNYGKCVSGYCGTTYCSTKYGN